MKTVKDLLQAADPLRYEPPLTAHERGLRREVVATAASDCVTPATATWVRARMAALATLTLGLIAALIFGSHVWPQGKIDLTNTSAVTDGDYKRTEAESIAQGIETPSRTGAQSAYRPGNGVSTPQLVKEVKAHYTPEARRAGIEGTVLMECVVQADGTVGPDIRVVRSLDPKLGLDREAVKAARQWLFKPGMKDNKPVPVLVTIEIAFTLRS